MDLYSRRIVGWAIEDHLRTELPLATLRMAICANIQLRIEFRLRREDEILSSPQSRWIGRGRTFRPFLAIRGSLLFDWRQRPRPMRAGLGSKGIQGVSHQNADAQYNYHCCDGLKHKRPPARSPSVTKGPSAQSKEIHRTFEIRLASEDF
jgi:hypothetical protein